jgi:hypothetical protein
MSVTPPGIFRQASERKAGKVNGGYSHAAWVHDIAASIRHEIDRHLRSCAVCQETKDCAYMAGLHRELDQWQAGHAGYFTQVTG